jgi:hypothetical protein
LLPLKKKKMKITLAASFLGERLVNFSKSASASLKLVATSSASKTRKTSYETHDISPPDGLPRSPRTASDRNWEKPGSETLRNIGLSCRGFAMKLRQSLAFLAIITF